MLVVASLGLAACGTSVQKTLKGALASVGAQQYLQVHLSASVAGTGASAAQAAQVQKVLSLVSMTMTEQNTTGSAISASAGKVNEEVTLDVGSSPLLDLVQVGQNLYVKVDFSAASSIPDLGSTASELTGLQLLLGGRWFEVPSTLLSSYLPAKDKSASQTARQHAIEERVVDALTALVEKTKYTTVSGGFSQTGTLQAVADALAPVMAQASSTAVSSPGKVAGTYHIALSLSGSTATGAQIGITAPNANKGDMSVSVSATIAHQSTAVVAPSPVTVITPQLIKSLSGAAGGSTL